MSVETQEYINGLRPGPLTREIPECMRDKYTVLQSVVDLIMYLVISLGKVIHAIYRTIVGPTYRDLKGNIALVTGGGGGLGSLIALRLARLGCKVVLWDINKQGVEDTVKLVKGIGGQCTGYVVDLAKKEDIYRVAKQVRIEVGRVSLLINNAGVVSGQYLLDTPDHLIQRTFDVNILAHFWTVKAFLPDMIAHKEGHIVTIASMAGYVGVPKLVDYCSSKAAACGFDEALKMELQDRGVHGVRTSLICPFFIRATGMFDHVNSRYLPSLSSNNVADRVVYAMRTNEPYALMPGIFRIGLAFKWLVPISVVSDFLRLICPDAVPDSYSHNTQSARESVESEATATSTATAKATATGTRKPDSRPMQLVPPERHDRQV